MDFSKILELINKPKVFIPLISICVAVLIFGAVTRYINRLLDKKLTGYNKKRKHTIEAMVKHIIKYIFMIVIVLIVLGMLGVDVSGIIASLGIAGVIAGLALQDALKDFIMGINIIVDNFFIIGDYVTFNNFTGEVIEFNLKTTKIKNEDGTVLVISNRNISQIWNLSQQAATIITKVKVANDVSEDKVMKVLAKVCESVDALGKSTSASEYLGIQSVGPNVEYAIKSYCRSGSKIKLKSEILSIVKKEFAKSKIDIQA